MEQRRLRLGDILDDYCPRERRITNHAVVAMIEDAVKQTRCTTCDAEHEYKQARVPAAKRRKTATPPAQLVDAVRAQADQDTPDEVMVSDEAAAMTADAASGEGPVGDLAVEADLPVGAPDDSVMASGESIDDDAAEGTGERDERDEWPVHRPLIRATLPRPEGHTPERKAPDFTFRPSGGKFDPNRNGQRHRGHRPSRQAHGHSPSGQGGSRFGGQRGPQGGGPQGPRHGNRSGQGGGPGRPGQGRGPRPGGGNRKRGR
jgi:hypothetical protein